MLTSLQSLARRVGRRASTPAVDEAFVADVRARLEPSLEEAGFAFDRAEPLAAAAGAAAPTGRRGVAVRYQVDPEPFLARFPGLAGHLRSEGDPLELSVMLDAARGTVRTELESFELAALLAVVRAGPGAPARRRELESGASEPLPVELALDRAVELLRRLVDAAAAR